MSTASVTNTFVDATTAEAADVNQNFDDLVAYINTNCIVKDGTLSLTANLATSATPSAATHLTTKSYVDGLVGMQSGQSTTSLFTTTNTAYQVVDTVTYTNPGKAVVVMAWLAAYGKAIAFCDRMELDFGISFDNGGTYTAAATDTQEIYATNSSADYLPFAAHVRKAGTPTGDIKIRARVKSRTTTGSTLNDCKIVYQVFKTVAL